MVRIIAVLRRKDGVSHEEFLAHWHDRHPEFVWRLPGLRRYVQHPPLPHRTPWPFDGVAELWFDSVRDVAIAFDAPVADEMRADEQHFVGSIEWILTDDVGREVPAGVADAGGDSG